MWSVDRTSVLSEILDGEAVIVDLSTGCYHAAAGVGATVWAGVVNGDSLEAIVAEVGRCHTDIPDDATAVISAFIETLVVAGLARPTVGTASTDGRLSTCAGEQTPWAAPILETHDDLADLMLIDPVHDVTERGWPDVVSDDS